MLVGLDLSLALIKALVLLLTGCVERIAGFDLLQIFAAWLARKGSARIGIARIVATAAGAAGVGLAAFNLRG